MKKKNRKKKIANVDVEKILDRLSSEKKKDIKATFGGLMNPVLYRNGSYG